MPQDEKRYFEFGPYRLDPAASVLTRNGKLVVLGPKAVETLVALVRKRGQVVSKEYLMKAVWPDAFVEDANLNVQISSLRKALEDSAENPSFIETAPRRGYRFLPQVREVTGEPEEAAQAAQPMALPKTLAAVRITRRVLAVGVLVSVAAVFAFTLWQGRAQTADKPVSTRFLVGVLPFTNLSGQAEQEYLSDGMTEELITELGRLNPQQMGVIARSSMMPYKGKNKDVREIARELGVQYVLEGGVLRAGNRVRITVKLIQASDQSQLWANQFDRDFSDLIAMQGEVARTVAQEMLVRLTPEAQKRQQLARAVSPQAYDAYLKGRVYWWMRTKEGYERARAYFEEALRIDPSFARAYAGLADTRLVYGLIGGDPRDMARKAVELDEGSAEAHTSLAMSVWSMELDWTTAEAHFRRALEIDPYYISAMHWYGFMLSHWGRHAEAIAQLERARQIDPLNIVVLTDLGQGLFFAGEYKRGMDPVLKAMSIDPKFPWPHYWYGRMLEAQGRLQEAMAQYQLADDLPYSRMDKNTAIACLLAKMGQPEKAREILRRLENGRGLLPRNRALIYAALGDRQRAIQILGDTTEKVYANTAVGAWVDPGFASLRSEPEFFRALAKVEPPKH